MLRKFLRQPFLVLAIMSVVFASCSDDDTEKEKLVSKIIGKIDGVSFAFDGEAQLYATEIMIASVSQQTEYLEIFVAKAYQRVEPMM